MENLPENDDQNKPRPDEPEWLREFEELAKRELNAEASCEQVHPVVQQWLEKLLSQEPPPARPSVMQAMACLSTEVMHHIPENIFNSMMNIFNEEELAAWLEYVLMVGRAFEISLRDGGLDDL